jgi:small redox-active disulfide protein 2
MFSESDFMKDYTIEIFGKGCRNCERLEENVREAVQSIGAQAVIIKITDMDDIANRNVFKTPGLAINGEIVSTGRVLQPEKIVELLK